MTDVRNPGAENFMALLDFLNDTPEQVATLIRELTAAELRFQNSPGEFSALENVCHLRDLELKGYATRINRMLLETEPALANFDGARVAAESNYHHEEPGAALRAFQQARRENVATLRSLTEEQKGRGGTLEGVGRITLRRLVEMMREHDEGHLEDLRVLKDRLKRRAGAASSDPA